MSDNAPQPPAAGEPAVPVLDAVASLHERIDELHQLVAGVHRPVPAWRRPTSGELRWPVSVTLCGAAALQTFVPDRLQLVRPSWVLPASMGVLLVALIGANPHRINRESRFLRSLGLVLGGLLSLANGWSVGRLAVDITQGTSTSSAAQLLVTGAIIWLTNVAVFALWYWEFDRGGPAARALNTGNRLPDFQFPQMTSPPSMVPPDWEPIFVDYLYLAFTCATAFSPTDVMPLSRWAKGAMTLQTLISIVTLVLVVARAVNVIPSP